VGVSPQGCALLTAERHFRYRSLFKEIDKIGIIAKQKSPISSFATHRVSAGVVLS